MKNFLDLLDTELWLTVSINNKIHKSGLHDQLSFGVDDIVTVDGIEILPRYQYLADNNVLTIAQPFYQWYHNISGQGWLLLPQ